MSLLAGSLAGRTAQPLDRKALAGEVAVRTNEEILAALRARLAQPIDDEQWDRLVRLAEIEARRQLVAEFGDPDPHRLA